MKNGKIMDNEEIIRNIKENKAAFPEKIDPGEPFQKYLVFSIESGKVSFKAELVKEIVLNTSVYFIPFCPPFISGLINRHGEPYTVIDLNVLLENQKQETNKFIIMNLKDDHIAFSIKDILEIADIPQSAIFKADLQKKENEFVQGFIDYNNEKVFIIDLDKINERLANEL